ncbi:MAG TPA: RsmE family RNA methyltransferase [Thermoanaerobaculia bacterium]|nr:RsmE family RNA methyltransferase [Thermoanaerobaculia bacterium]
MITLLVEPPSLAGEELTVAAAAYRHLFRARRLAPGARLRVVDGQGRARWGEVARVGRASALVRLGGPAPGNEPALRLELLVATLRPERAAWLVEKVTELGVAAVRFVGGERAPRRFGGGTLERLRRVAGAAVEQCHRSLCPDLSGPHDLADADRLAAGLAGRWLLDRDGIEPAAGGFGPPQPSGALLVGPEGGWSPAERDTLIASLWRPVALGPRVLRIETAATIGAALLLLQSPPQ